MKRVVQTIRKVGNLICAHPYITLTAAFLLTVVLRCLLVFKTSMLPSIMADEMRYLSISSSLVHEGILPLSASIPGARFP